MPKVGIWCSKSAGSSVGAPASYTLEGPPLKIIAVGFLATISATDMVEGTISE